MRPVSPTAIRFAKQRRNGLACVTLAVTAALPHSNTVWLPVLAITSRLSVDYATSTFSNDRRPRQHAYRWSEVRCANERCRLQCSSTSTASDIHRTCSRRTDGIANGTIENGHRLPHQICNAELRLTRCSSLVGRRVRATNLSRPGRNDTDVRTDKGFS